MDKCNIIRDILPLYAEKMVSADTAAFVEEHLKTCEDCRKAYDRMGEAPAVRETEAVPLLRLRKKMAVKKAQTVALTALFVIALLVSAFAVLDAPVYLPYTSGRITVEETDGGVEVRFDQSVTDFSCHLYPDPKEDGLYYCDVEAWTSAWDRLFSKNRGELSTVIRPEKPGSLTVMYVPNDGSESVCVYGEAGDERGTVLPRLTLGYYLVLAAAALGVLGILWLLTKGKENLRVWTERLALYPVSYMAGHLLVAGCRFPTYSMPRDFLLIVFVSILLYAGLLLAHSVWRLQKEIRQISR